MNGEHRWKDVIGEPRPGLVMLRVSGGLEVCEDCTMLRLCLEPRDNYGWKRRWLYFKPDHVVNDR